MNSNITHEETVTKVLEALESIRPFLNRDGGDIELVDIEDNKVYVKLRGNCSGCKNSTLTLKHFVESTLRELLKEDVEVIEV